MSNCPICGTTVPSRDVPSFPFCSPRCKQIDLKRWLGEEYSLPQSERDDEADPDRVYDPDDE